MDVDAIPVDEKNKPNEIINRSKLTPRGVIRGAIIGSSGAGKTYSLLNIFICSMHEPIGGITIVAKNKEQATYRAIEEYCKTHEYPYKMTDNYTREDFDKQYQTDIPRLIIFDDIIAGKKGQGDDFSAMQRAYRFGRTKNIYCVCMSQDIATIPNDVKTNINMYILFPLNSIHVKDNFIRYLSSFCDFDALERAYTYITDKDNRYSCIIINLMNSKYPNLIMTANRDLYDIITGDSIDLNKDNKLKDNKKNDNKKK